MEQTLEVGELKKIPKFMTVKAWCETIGYMTEGGLRHLIFTNSEFNKRVVKRLGRRILLDVAALDAFIDEQIGTINSN
jgi:hypothetical protein